MAPAEVHVGMSLQHELGALSERILHTSFDLSIARLGHFAYRRSLRLVLQSSRQLLSSNVWLCQQVHPQGVANLFCAFEGQVTLGSNARREMTRAAGALLPARQRLLPQQEGFPALAHR